MIFQYLPVPLLGKEGRTLCPFTDVLIGNDMTESKNDFLNTAIRAAKLAGQFILDNLGRISKNEVYIKKASDFVTRVEKDTEKISIDTIKENIPEQF